MAGDWLKFQKATLDKPEVFEISEALSLDCDSVVGKLLRIWCWFDEHSEDGTAPVTVRALLDRYAGVTGFVTEMEKVGWMIEEGGRLILPKFDRHNGKTAKTRALGKNRAESHRGKSNANSNASSVTKALPEKRREEKRREEPDQEVDSSVKDCRTIFDELEPEGEPIPTFSESDSTKSQQAVIERVKRGLQWVNPEWLPHMTQMEMIDLRANLSLWAEIPRHYWLLMRWWYSRKRPALARQHPTATHYPFAERAGLLKDTTRCLDAIADKWNKAGKPALEPKQKNEGKKVVPEHEEKETDPLDSLTESELSELRRKVEAGPLSEIDQMMMKSDNQALREEHVKMLMREHLQAV